MRTQKRMDRGDEPVPASDSFQHGGSATTNELVRRRRVKGIVITTSNQKAWLIAISFYTALVLIASLLYRVGGHFCETPTAPISFWISVAVTTIILSVISPLRWGLAIVFTGVPHITFTITSFLLCSSIARDSMDSPILAGVVFVLSYIANMLIVSYACSVRLRQKSAHWQCNDSCSRWSWSARSSGICSSSCCLTKSPHNNPVGADRQS